MKPKRRLDVLLVERGLADTRKRAQSLIIAGKVFVNDEPQIKAGHSISLDAMIRVKGQDHPYVSRGGVKLQAALDSFKIQVQGKIALDIGASTGGFTHVLLLQGAAKVHAIDVGHNQMDWKLRQDSRVLLQEKVNARSMVFHQIGEWVDIVVVDVSFISLEKILPALVQFSQNSTDWITLIKPQFEVGRDKVGKGGIVHSDEDHQAVIERITRFAETLGLMRCGLIESPIVGTEGNKEFLAHWKLHSLDP